MAVNGSVPPPDDWDKMEEDDNGTTQQEQPQTQTTDKQQPQLSFSDAQNGIHPVEPAGDR